MDKDLVQRYTLKVVKFTVGKKRSKEHLKSKGQYNSAELYCLIFLLSYLQFI